MHSYLSIPALHSEREGEGERKREKARMLCRRCLDEVRKEGRMTIDDCAGYTNALLLSFPLSLALLIFLILRDGRRRLTTATTEKKLHLRPRGRSLVSNGGGLALSAEKPGDMLHLLCMQSIPAPGSGSRRVHDMI